VLAARIGQHQQVLAVVVLDVAVKKRRPRRQQRLSRRQGSASVHHGDPLSVDNSQAGSHLTLRFVYK
jgi:hypothetical protein